MTVLSVQGLEKYYGKTQVLHGVGFELSAGEILGFIGPNGAGKSTTMKCIAGLESYRGVIRVMGHDLVRERVPALNHIGLSIESPGLYPQLSGLDHLKFFCSLRRLPAARVHEMAEFSRLGDALRRPTGAYSMGMKQRLALALALLPSPALLLLDEPTNGLDPGAVFSLRRELKALKEQGVAILYSSHQLGELERTCDRMLFIREGRLIHPDDAGEAAFRSFNIYTEDKEKLLSAIKARFPDMYAALAEDGAVELRLSQSGDFSAVIRLIAGEGLSVTAIHENAINLEERYAGLYQA